MAEIHRRPPSKHERERKQRDPVERRLQALRAVFICGALVVAAKLFAIQVLSHGFYLALASGQHGIFEELFPERGDIYMGDRDAKNGLYPAATNENLTLVYANPREIADPEKAAAQLAPMLSLEETDIAAKLGRRDDPYEPLKRRVPDDIVAAIRKLDLRGVGFAPEQVRVYPERSMVGHVIGFVGSTEKGERVGRYGAEGYWNAELAGERGFLESEKDPTGRWIGTAGRSLRAAKDGDDVVLSIDRTIQYVACDRLKKAVQKHGADGGSVVVMDPKTGAILAMCSMPDFDPNEYAKVANPATFNNPAIFTAYEPGSVFKPITMAAALDAGKVAPGTTYNDEGSVVIGPYTIKNSDGAANGVQTMTQVLEKSLNTGMIFAVRQLGAVPFRNYVEDFGFGSRSGVELDTEAAGDVSSLARKGDIWSATASFGQGISVTPLQLASAYAVIANGGKLMKPTIVKEIRHPDGSITSVEPKVVRQVITKRSAALVGGMLVRVVENGHGKRAGVPGYYVAGKTGTAQVPRKDGQGYEKDLTIGSFAGFAPVDDPSFVMIVKIEHPRDVQWAEASAAPLFGEIAKFLLDYLQVPPTRK